MAFIQDGGWCMPEDGKNIKLGSGKELTKLGQDSGEILAEVVKMLSLHAGSKWFGGIKTFCFQKFHQKNNFFLSYNLFTVTYKFH